MKTLLLVILLSCAALAATAQEWKSPLPVDSASHKITYQGVVQVPGATQVELYARALAWLNASFGPAIAQLETASPATGTLAANGYANFNYAFMGKAMPWAMWRRVRIEAKDGRYRYTITDFRLGGPLLTPESSISPVDEWLAPTMKKSKQPGKLAQSVIDGVEQSTAAQISSLQARMSQATAKAKDW